MFVYCIFLAGYKDHESARNDAEKPQNGCRQISQGREYSL